MGKTLGLVTAALFVALGAAADAASAADPTQPVKHRAAYDYRHRHPVASPQAPAAAPEYVRAYVPVYVPAYLDRCRVYAYGAVTWACAGQSPDNTGNYSNYF